jgi:hypothetical protein
VTIRCVAHVPALTIQCVAYVGSHVTWGPRVVFVHTAVIDRRILEGFEETLWEQSRHITFKLQPLSRTLDSS